MEPSRPPAPSGTNSQTGQQAQAAQGQPDPAPNQSAPAPPVAQPLQPTVVQPDPANNAGEHENHPSAEWGIFWATVGLVVITAVLAFYTAMLFRTTKRLGESAKATSDNQTSSYKLSERAWVAHDVIVYLTVFTETTPKAIRGVRFTVRLINAGKTPAIETVITTDHRVVTAAEDIPNFRPTIEQEQRSTPMVPNQQFHSIPRQISAADLAQILRGERKLFLYAQIQYKDVFNEDIARITECCWEAIPTGTDMQNGLAIPSFMFIARGPQNRAT